MTGASAVPALCGVADVMVVARFVVTFAVAVGNRIETVVAVELTISALFMSKVLGTVDAMVTRSPT